MSALPVEQIDLQPILIERIERLEESLWRGDDNNAIEQLVRIGLFLSAAPLGSTLIRNGGRVECDHPRAIRRMRTFHFERLAENPNGLA